MSVFFGHFMIYKKKISLILYNFMTSQTIYITLLDGFKSDGISKWSYKLLSI